MNNPPPYVPTALQLSSRSPQDADEDDEHGHNPKQSRPAGYVFPHSFEPQYVLDFDDLQPDAFMMICSRDRHKVYVWRGPQFSSDSEVSIMSHPGTETVRRRRHLRLLRRRRPPHGRSHPRGAQRRVRRVPVVVLSTAEDKVLFTSTGRAEGDKTAFQRTEGRTSVLAGQLVIQVHLPLPSPRYIPDSSWPLSISARQPMSRSFA